MRWCLLASIAVALAGCTPAHIDVRPRAGELIVTRDLYYAQRVRVPESGPGGLDLTVVSSGVYRREHRKKKVVAVSFLVVAQNRSETEKASVDPRGAILVDRMGHDLVPMKVTDPETSSDETTLTIEPGAERATIVHFATAATDDPRDLLPAALQLPVAHGRAERRVTFVFERLWSDYYYGYPYAYYPGYPYGYYGRPYGWGAAGWYYY